MTQIIKISDLPDFDFTEHLDSEQAIAEYLTLVLEDGDSALLAAAEAILPKPRDDASRQGCRYRSRESLQGAQARLATSL
ncbi:hypothetical protein ACVBEH_14400 [Roseateles sp. GG27B]